MSARAAAPPLWTDASFLQLLAEFYRDEAPDLCGHAVVEHSATSSADDLLRSLAALVPALAHPAGVQVACSRAGTGLYDAAFRVAAGWHGRSSLGRPVARSFRQLGRTVRAFERHLLVIGRRGCPFLQAQSWSPPCSRRCSTP